MQYANGSVFEVSYSRMYSPRMTIGDRLDKAMRDAEIASQSELARLSGVPQATISRILKGGGKKGPETETIKKLAKACRVTFDWLNEGQGDDALLPKTSIPVQSEKLPKELAAELADVVRGYIEGDADTRAFMLDAARNVLDRRRRSSKNAAND